MSDPNLIRQGAGDPLLLIHGIHHSAQAWELMIPALAEDFDVLAVNLPGHGGAPNLTEEPTTDALADHLEAILDREGLDTVHVAGNSMGGLLAIRMGERGRARSVTAFSPGGMVRPGPEQAYTRLLAKHLFVNVSPLVAKVPAVAGTAVGRSLAMTTVLGRPDLVPPVHAQGILDAVAQATDPDRTYAGMETWVEDVKPVDAPVTIAWGDRDRLLRSSQGVRWKAALPDARLVRLRTLGHLPMAEDPALCVNLIRQTAGSAG